MGLASNYDRRLRLVHVVMVTGSEMMKIWASWNSHLEHGYNHWYDFEDEQLNSLSHFHFKKNQVSQYVKLQLHELDTFYSLCHVNEWTGMEGMISGHVKAKKDLPSCFSNQTPL